MSSGVNPAVLKSMMEDLGLGRIEELPMEDGENSRGGTRGGFFGGASRGGFHGGGRGRGNLIRGKLTRDNLARATRETVQAITALKSSGAQNAWQAAVASNAFDDDDAAEVKGLDTLGDGNLHRMRNASQDVTSSVTSVIPYPEIPPGELPPGRDPVRSTWTRAPIPPFSNDPVPEGPIRRFPPGYAKSPANGATVKGDSKITTKEDLSKKQERIVPAPVKAIQSPQPTQQPITPAKKKFRLERPDSASILITDEIRMAVKDYKTFLKGQAYLCGAPAPVTAFIAIIIDHDQMDDAKYPVAQWKEYLHMEKCFIPRFEVRPGESTALCLEFKTASAMGKFAHAFEALLKERDTATARKSRADYKAGLDPSAPGDTLGFSKQTEAQSTGTPLTGAKTEGHPSLPSVTSAKTPEISKENSKQRDAPSVLQAAWQKNQALTFKQQKVATPPGTSVPGESTSHDIPIRSNGKPYPESSAEPAVSDTSEDDAEKTLRDCLLNLRDNVTVLAKAQGLETSADLDATFRAIVETFVSQTTESYNEADDDGKQDIVQAYYDLAMKPRKASRRTYSSEQLMELRDKADAPSESQMAFVPPVPKSKSAGSDEANTLSPTLAHGVPATGISSSQTEDVARPHSNGPSVQDQIKKVAGNASWAFASHDTSKVSGNQNIDQSKKPAATREYTETVKPTGLSASRWATDGDELKGLSGSRWASSDTPASNAEPVELLIPGLDGVSEVPVKSSSGHVADKTGGAQNTGMNMKISGNAADLVGLVIDDDKVKHEKKASLGGIESDFQKLNLLD